MNGGSIREESPEVVTHNKLEMYLDVVENAVKIIETAALVSLFKNRWPRPLTRREVRETYETFVPCTANNAGAT